jgi:hypothetical protein
MYNKYLKYKSKYLNLKMIGGTIDIYSLASDNFISFKIEKDQPIFQLFNEMDKHIYSIINKNYIEYKLLEDSKVLDRGSTRKIQDITVRITYVISEYKLLFNNLEELVEYINENDTINDYSIYYYIMHKMISDDLVKLHQELSDNIQLKELLSNKIINDINSMKLRYYLPVIVQDNIFFKRINNKNFILKAIQIDFGIFRYVNDELKNDRDFILKAIQIDSGIFKYVNDELKNDRDFILEAIKIDIKIFSYIDNVLEDDKTLILDALKIISKKSRRILFTIIHDKFKRDEDFMLKCIKIDPYLMSKAHSTLNQNKQFILSAIRIDPISFYYAAYDNNDKEFIKEAIKIDPKTFFYAFPKSITESELDSSSQNKIQDLKKNEEFILNSSNIHSIIFDYVR